MPVNPSADAGWHGKRAVSNPVVDGPFTDAKEFCCCFFGNEFVRNAHDYTEFKIQYKKEHAKARSNHLAFMLMSYFLEDLCSNRAPMLQKNAAFCCMYLHVAAQ